MTVRALTSPTTSTAPVPVCPACIPKTLPQLPPLPGKAAALHADTLLRSRLPLEPMTVEQAFNWIKHHLNAEYAEAWLNHVNENEIKYEN